MAEYYIDQEIVAVANWVGIHHFVEGKPSRYHKVLVADVASVESIAD